MEDSPASPGAPIPGGFTASSLDALPPPEMARRSEQVGIAKAALRTDTLLALGVLAGAFIAMGAIFATTVTAGGADLPYGISRLLAGLTFSLGLILVVVAGAELFTGNNLVVMAWASRRITSRRLLWTWLLVYVGNFGGAIATAGIMYLSRQYRFGGGAVGDQVLTIAAARSDHQETSVGSCFHEDVGSLALYDTGLGLNACRVRSLRRSVNDFLGHFLEGLVEGLIKLGSEAWASVGDRGHVPRGHEPEP
jgi:hypothetical protein